MLRGFWQRPKLTWNPFFCFRILRKFLCWFNWFKLELEKCPKLPTRVLPRHRGLRVPGFKCGPFNCFQLNSRPGWTCQCLSPRSSNENSGKTYVLQPLGANLWGQTFGANLWGKPSGQTFGANLRGKPCGANLRVKPLRANLWGQTLGGKPLEANLQGPTFGGKSSGANLWAIIVWYSTIL